MASLRKAVTVSSFFARSIHRRLHPHHHRLTAFSPSAAHSFSTGDPFNVNSQNPSGPVKVEIPDYEMNVVNNNLCCIRFDVPGLTAEDLKLWVDENKVIRFEGRCKSQPKYEDEGRLYEGVIENGPWVLEMDQLKAELKHGVLWISLPLNEYAKKWQRNMEYSE
ncbi:26.2 kDa heat shock protein, mitochondrial-like [Cornus florida]|uniref:26.2 kDa heat shock protein, mitochondrial-like n=1 Tax=Cornus florida TaxID=4283 RepID=UPI0028A03209|nr:26.2 kDa heat shock protein, mitochondrial-like [Cornus florida]